MSTAETVAICLGAGQLLMAFLLWLGIDRKNMSERLQLKGRSWLVLLLIVGGWAFSGYVYYEASHGLSLHWKNVVLTEVSGKTFINEQVKLDGFSYHDCTFRNVTFVYDGTGPFGLDNNEIYAPILIQTSNDAVAGTAIIFRGLGMLKEDIPVTLNHKELEHVHPPLTGPKPK